MSLLIDVKISAHSHDNDAELVISTFVAVNQGKSTGSSVSVTELNLVRPKEPIPR